MHKNKNLTRTLSIFKKAFIIIIVIFLMIVISFKISPKPTAYIAKKLIFDPTPNKKSPDNIEGVLSNILLESNLEYPSTFGSNKFDLYKPKSTNTPVPVVIWAHGGGFVGGDKFMLSDYSAVIASNDYAVVAFNYSTSLKNKYPTPIIQVSELIDHLLLYQKEYNIDMNNIIFAGDSAGAQIVSQYVITQTNSEYLSAFDIEKKLIDNQIKGMLLYCGIYDIEDLLDSENSLMKFIYNNLGWAYLGEKDWSNSDIIQEASIFNNINDSFPPAYITDGNTFSFESSAKSLVSTLNELGIDNVSRFFSKENGDIYHEFQFNLQTHEGELVLEDTLDFLNSRTAEN